MNGTRIERAATWRCRIEGALVTVTRGATEVVFRGTGGGRVRLLRSGRLGPEVVSEARAVALAAIAVHGPPELR